MSANETTLHPNNTEQKAIKDPKITSVKPFKRENQQSNLYKKRETRNTYKLHKQKTTTVHQISDLGQVEHLQQD